MYLFIYKLFWVLYSTYVLQCFQWIKYAMAYKGIEIIIIVYKRHLFTKVLNNQYQNLLIRLRH